MNKEELKKYLQENLSIVIDRAWDPENYSDEIYVTLYLEDQQISSSGILI